MTDAIPFNRPSMMGREQEVGSLEPQKAADFIVLDRALDDSSSAADVLATKVAYVFTDGKMRIGR